MLEIFRCYTDICKEIDFMERQIEIMEKEKEDWWIDGRHFNKVPMHLAAERVDRLTSRIEMYKTIIGHNKKQIEDLEYLMGTLEEDEYRVAYMRFVEKKPLECIADELNKSVPVIKKISAKVTKHLEKHVS